MDFDILIIFYYVFNCENKDYGWYLYVVVVFINSWVFNYWEYNGVLWYIYLKKKLIVIKRFFWLIYLFKIMLFIIIFIVYV